VPLDFGSYVISDSRLDLPNFQKSDTPASAGILNCGRACTGIQIFVEANPDFAQILAAAIELHGRGRNGGVRFQEIAPDLVSGDAQILLGLPVDFRNNYFAECRTNTGKVILLIQPAACSMDIPFMLNECRTGHELQHLILKIRGNRRLGRATIRVRRAVVIRPKSVSDEGKSPTFRTLTGISIQMLGITTILRRPGQAQQIIIEIPRSRIFHGGPPGTSVSESSQTKHKDREYVHG
jgi:hypothetical protein